MNEAMRCAIVTGGGQGIGKCVARRLLEAGKAVVLAEIDQEAGCATAAELSAIGTLRFVQTDVADEDSVRRMLDAAARQFNAIDLLVNNAGIGRNAPVEQLSLADWNRVLAVNLTGMFLCAKHAAPHLRSAKGAIVNIASTRALMSERNTEAYSASKGGIVALTHALAVSLGPEVRVNCISPGWIDTSGWRKAGSREQTELSADDHGQHPAGRVGTPDDIAALVLFLASAQSEFVTGQNFVADGGMTKKMIYVE
jgi:NAD(P)-dependent dehydrogenase (short-subunit alcohol dehydrogenase family)